MRREELRDLLISALVLAFLFAYEGIGALANLIYAFPLALLAISLAFLGHELAHRYVAMRNGCRAEYRMWPQGLLFAVLLALLSDGRIVFAAPGAVVIYPLIDLWGRGATLTREQEVRIALAGPAANLLLGLLFLALGLTLGVSLFFKIASINAWLAVFNLLPIDPLDGAKIWRGNKRAWTAAIAFALLLYFLLLLF